MFRPNGTDLKVRQELSWLTGEILRNGKHVEQAEWLGSEGTILYSGWIFSPAYRRTLETEVSVTDVM